jgi:tripartite-type tricarboxylate transporter receptor subunit TctC
MLSSCCHPLPTLTGRCNRLSATLLLAALSLSILPVQGLQAQSWPSRPVRLVVGQNPGSSPDVIARLLTERLSARLGQQVLVENRGGGDGAMGAQVVARSSADGHTLLFATAGAIVVNQFTSRSIGYQPERDLVGVAMIGMSPFILVANPDMRLRTVAELAAYARSEPMKVAYTSPGPRSLPGMIAELFALRAGATMVNVPNNGSMGLQDVMSGRTAFSLQGIPAVMAAIRGGRLVPLAVTSAKRLPELDGVPTLAETWPGFDPVGWFAILAPAGTRTEVIERLNHELDLIVSQPEVTARLQSLGIYPEPGLRARELDQFITSQRSRWGNLVRELHIEPQ